MSVDLRLTPDYVICLVYHRRRDLEKAAEQVQYGSPNWIIGVMTRTGAGVVARVAVVAGGSSRAVS